MDNKTIKNVIEAAMFAAGRPMSMNELLRLFSEDERPERKVMHELIEGLQSEYKDRGIELVEVASGYRTQVRHEMGEWLGRLDDRRPPKYSRALMETLALIAYRQPITRGDIEEVRGVSVSSNIVRTLLERGWVRIVGHRDVPGRPAMFGTTKEFLDYFNLKTLDELPSLAEIKDIDSLNSEFDFGDVEAAELEFVESNRLVDAEAADDLEGPSKDGEAVDIEDGDIEPTEASESDAAEDAEEESGAVEEYAEDEDDDDDDEDFEGWGVDDEDEEVETAESESSVSVAKS